MHLSRVNLILSVLLLLSVFALFLQFFKLTGELTFAGRRIDELEKRPIANNTQNFPEAGESAVVFVSPTPTVKSGSTPSPTSSALVNKTASPTTAASPKPEKKVTYLPIYGGGYQTTQTAWVDVPGSEFQLNINDYGASAYPTFEATAWVIGGSGSVRIRLLDVTNGVVVDGSTIAGSSSSPALIISGKLNFFSGQNTYRVQLSSETSSTVEFDFGRVKIVYY